MGRGFITPLSVRLLSVLFAAAIFSTGCQPDESGPVRVDQPDTSVRRDAVDVTTGVTKRLPANLVFASIMSAARGHATAAASAVRARASASLWWMPVRLTQIATIVSIAREEAALVREASASSHAPPWTTVAQFARFRRWGAVVLKVCAGLKT